MIYFSIGLSICCSAQRLSLAGHYFLVKLCVRGIKLLLRFLLFLSLCTLLSFVLGLLLRLKLGVPISYRINTR